MIQQVSLLIFKPLDKNEKITDRFNRFVYCSEPIIRNFKILSSYLSRKQNLDPVCFSILFPIIQGIYTLPNVIPGCENAFSILESCWSPEFACQTSVRPMLVKVVETTLKVLANIRAEQSNAETFLIRILTQNRLESQEWHQVLGNEGILSSSEKVKLAILKSLKVMIEESSSSNLPIEAMSKIWVLRFDEEQTVQELANLTWEIEKKVMSSDCIQCIFPLLLVWLYLFYILYYLFIFIYDFFNDTRYTILCSIKISM